MQLNQLMFTSKTLSIQPLSFKRNVFKPSTLETTWILNFLKEDCRLSKYNSQKPEFTRRTIYNRGSTLQFIVQISSGNVNSSVRAQAKTHGRTPVSIELPRGRHLGSDACIF